MVSKIMKGFIAMLLVLPIYTGNAANTKYELATFAGGCFWCMVHPFDKLPGVKEVLSGYTGGHTVNPTYKENSSGTTGHAESIQITYDPSKISYADLLEVFWRQIDPTDAGGQFVDRGNQYRSAIFYHNDEQKRLAEESRDRLAKSGRFTKPIVTEIVKAGPFYKAEEYHQYYYKKNPIRYKYYRYRSGRDQFLDKAWGKDREYVPAKAETGSYTKPSVEVLKKKLTPMQFKVTQKKGTEPAFDNAYWNNKHEGIYVDISQVSPCSAQRTSMIQVRAGQALPGLWSPAISWRSRTIPCSRQGQRSGANMQILILGMYSMMAHLLRDCAIA